MMQQATSTDASLVLRPIEARDNDGVRRLVRDVLAEFGYTGPGIAADDPELADSFAFYQDNGSAYWVL
jgi:putative acetyltransferase